MTRNRKNSSPAEADHIIFDKPFQYDTSFPVLSVIIPVYNVERYIRRCLESITEQTYKNIEIIIVDDHSPQNEKAVIESFCRNDFRMKYIRHTRNMGLFQARITGMKYARGEYFAFLDSDDHVSVDYYRLLMNKVIDSQADMVIGDFVDEYEDGRIEYYNFDNIRFRDIELTGGQVYETFMKQHGLWFGWHTVWNKVYKRSIWDASRSELEEFSGKHGHLIMTEDIAFSSVFWSCAGKVVNCHNAFYYYFHHSGQSVANSDLQKFEKNLRDVCAVFEFFREFLIRRQLFERYQKDYEKFLEVYIQFWTGNADALPEAERKSGRKLVQKLFGHVAERKDKDHFHYSMKTPVASFEFYEDIKRNICSEQIEIVCFDVFDTLLVRPFLEPSDLFALMNPMFNDLVQTRSYVDFQKIRIQAEKALREELKMGVEEVRLADIYRRIGEIFNLTEEQTGVLKNAEIDLELQFIQTRNTGKELFELARAMKKRILCVSDMYLPCEMIEKMLQKCGYEADRIYVSSDYFMTKQSGKLYEVVARTEKKDPQKIMHIGDNWNSDVVMAKNAGMKSYHLAAPVCMFKGENPGIYSGHSYRKIWGPAGNIYMGESAAEYLGIRCMLALAANRIFDNPYVVQFHPDTDFNCNPYYMGYYLVGMHLYAVVNWIIKTVEEEKRNTVHFVSRDGFLPKKAYDILAGSRNLRTDSGYLYISRKATAPLQSSTIADTESFLSSFSSYEIPVKSPVDTFAVIAKEKYKDSIENLGESGMIYFSRTGGFTESMQLGKKLFEDYFDADRSEVYVQKVKDHFKKVLNENDIIFDLGYRANKEHILSSLIERPVDCLYLYTNESKAIERSLHRGFSIRTFYDYTPTAYAAARELVFSEIAPSCIGFDVENQMAPVFDPDYEEHYLNQYVLDTMQNAALDFVNEFERTFKDTEIPFLFRNFDASLPFEYFMHFSTGEDRRILECITFEDDTFAGKPVKLVDEWQNAIHYHRLDGRASEKEVVQNVIRSNSPDHTAAIRGGEWPEGLGELYSDGLFVQAFRTLNRTFPVGSRRRERIKKILSLFMRGGNERI